MMKYLALISTLFATRLFAAEILFDFSSTPLNEQPSGFLSTVSGEGEPGKWRVVEDEAPSAFPALTANAPVNQKRVLAQLSRDITEERYPLLIYTNEVFGDFTFRTRFKTVGGVVERMAGVVFRYQDENNYYYLRASSKGGTFRFFKVVAGQRSAPIGPAIEIPSGEWHELSVSAKGNELKMSLNGEQIIPTAFDNSFSSGHVGFWTMADSVSHFTDAKIVYTPRESRAKVLLRQIHERYPRVLGMRMYGATPGNPAVRVMAATDDSLLDLPGTDVEQNVIENAAKYFGRLDKGVVVTMPVKDRNGDVVAALRIEMKSFPGQTENNALARALPIVKDMEARVIDARDLF